MTVHEAEQAGNDHDAEVALDALVLAGAIDHHEASRRICPDSQMDGMTCEIPLQLPLRDAGERPAQRGRNRRAVTEADIGRHIGRQATHSIAHAATLCSCVDQ